MKVILLLCLAVICTSHMAAAITRAEIISLLQQDYTIDRVLQLFEALRTQENQDLVDLDAEYAVQEPALAAEIVRTTGLLNAKIAECDGIEALINSQIADRQRMRDNIATAQSTIDANNQKVKDLEDARCAANILYVGRLAQNQEAVEFLTYLRNRVAEPGFRDYLAGNQAAFLQIKESFKGSKTDEILSMLTQHHLLSLLQQDVGQGYQGDLNLEGTYNVHARTAEEVGTGHLDNTRGAMQRTEISVNEQDVEAYVQQLLGFIDQLVASFNSSTEALRAAEQEAVQALIDYRNRIKDENFVLNRYIEVTTVRVADLSLVIENNQRALAQCRDEIPPLQEGVRVAQENYDVYVAAYTERRNNLVSTIDLLGRVIDLYTTEVVNVAGTEYRERTQDYLTDQNFGDTGGFTARGSTSVTTGYQL